jgi:hypothetical protein
MNRIFIVGAFVLICVVSGIGLGQKPPTDLPKLSADEIISKHVASIGAPKPEALTSRVLVGTGEFSSKVRPEKVGGPVQFASAGSKLLLAFIFNANNYPYDKIGFDGKDLSIAALPGGGYSPLDNFLKSNKVIVRRGLFGGVLSQSWPLVTRDKEVKFEAAGTSKIDNKNAYKLKVSFSGIGDMSVVLYFEPETFRHVRSEYFYRTGQLTTPNPNRPGQIGGMAPESYTLTEDFSNFTKVDDFVLPMTYSLVYESQAGKALNWTINFTQVYNNQTIDDAAFRIS